jgi:hypothetical protein
MPHTDLDDVPHGEVTPAEFAALPCPQIAAGFFTVVYPCGTHRTWRVRLEKHGPRRATRSLSLLIGPDNTNDYLFVATLREAGLEFAARFRRPNCDEDSRAAKAANLWWRLAAGESVEGHELLVSERCRWCMRELTDPASVTTRLGPTCRKKLGIK